MGVAALLLALASLYMVGDHGLDQMNEVRPGDLNAVSYLESHAPARSQVLAVASYLPLDGYPRQIPVTGLSLATITSPGTAGVYVRTLSRTVAPRTPTFLLITQQGEVSGEMQGYFSYPQLAWLTGALQRSPAWAVVFRSPTSTVYRSRP